MYKKPSLIDRILLGLFLLLMGAGVISVVGSHLLNNKPFNPTPEAGYTGNCTHWTYAKNHEGENTCVWGVALDGETSFSGIYLHFSPRHHPYPDFSALLKANYWSFKVTGENVTNRFGGRCIEIYGVIYMDSNTYNGETAYQPLMNVRDEKNIRFCDN